MSLCSWIKGTQVGTDTTDREAGAPVNAPITTPEAPVILKPGTWDHLDPTHIVPTQPLKLMLDYYDAHSSDFPNKAWFWLVDYTKHSGRKRLYLIDTAKGTVEAHCCAHGTNSDPTNSGFATIFSNNNGSEQSTLGLVKTNGLYDGKHPHSMVLIGLSKSNSHMKDRSIVMHGSTYVSDSFSKQGRSWGCPALQDNLSLNIVNRLKGGSLGFHWHSDYFSQNA